MLKVLFVGGTWGKREEARESHLVDKIADEVLHYKEELDILVHLHNGGEYFNLEGLLNQCSSYDIVFWFPNVVDNTLPKLRSVKEVAPRVMLVTSKRNVDNKYSFGDLVQRALALKSNLVFEFTRPEYEGRNYVIKVFDPLGCVFAETSDVKVAVHAAMERLVYLRSITRQSTIQSSISKESVFSQYFTQSEREVSVPNEQAFVRLVRRYAEQFQSFLPKPTTRFLGNASIKVPSFRCGKGMPSFRKGGYVFVSKRNIDKQFIELENFVPCYMEDDKLFYCGEDKPSVDTPVQMRIYEALPNINYIIHGHCYINSPSVLWTDKCIPCGAIEEADTVKSLLIDKEVKRALINLKGHGCLILGETLEDLLLSDDERFEARPVPEAMYRG